MLMKGQIILLVSVFVPILGAFFLPFIGAFSVRLRKYLALCFVTVSFISATMMLEPLLKGQTPYSFNWQFQIATINISFGLLADWLAVFMAMISTFVSAIILLYSFGYISHYKNQNEYYLMVVLFIGAMMGIVFSTSLIFLYLFWEISAICCWRLIGFFREKEFILRADKAFLVTVFGALVMLLGFIIIYQQTGTFDLTQMQGVTVSNVAVLLIMFGIFSKSATLPLHTWLPDAGVAPSSVTSLLHAAVLVKIGVYVFARLFIINFNMDVMWHTVIPVIAGVSALVSAGAALKETNLKRIIAYSTISQLGFIFLGLSTGSKLAAAGGLLYIMMHSLAKAGLFLCAGIIEQTSKEKDITKMGGFITKMPITAIAFLTCAFSVMGIPPFGGFFSKYMVISGTVTSGHPWIAMTFVVGAILTVIYLFRVFTMVFLGQVKLPSLKKEGSTSMLASVTILSVLSLAGGILIYYPSSFVYNIVNQIGVMLK